MHYKRIRNRATSQLRLAKKKFFNNLNLSNPKSFWKSIKALDGWDTSVCTQNHNGNPFATDERKANALNDYLTSCFNGSIPPVTTITPDANNECLSDILCAEEEIIMHHATISRRKWLRRRLCSHAQVHCKFHCSINNQTF